MKKLEEILEGKSIKKSLSKIVEYVKINLYNEKNNRGVK